MTSIETVYILLNSGLQHYQLNFGEELPHPFYRAMLSFQKYLEKIIQTEKENSTVQALLVEVKKMNQALKPTTSRRFQEETAPCEDIQKLAVGDTYWLNSNLRLAPLFYCFKRVSNDIVLVTAYLGTANDAALHSADSLFMLLNAGEPVTYSTYHLDWEKIKQTNPRNHNELFMQFLHQLSYHYTQPKSIEETEQKAVRTLSSLGHKTTTTEPFSSDLLDQYSYFARALHRFFHGSFADSFLESIILNFITRTLLRSGDSSHLRVGLTNHLYCLRTARQPNLLSESLPSLTQKIAITDESLLLGKIDFKPAHVSAFEAAKETRLTSNPARPQTFKPMLLNLSASSSEDLHANLTDFLDNLKQNSEQSATFSIINSIEDFVLHCATDIEQYKAHPSSYTTEQWQALGEQFYDLYQHYRLYMQRMLPDVPNQPTYSWSHTAKQKESTPKMWITTCTLITLIKDCYRYRHQHNTYSEQFAQAIDHSLSSQIAKVQSLPYFSTSDPRFDQHWLTILATYSFDPTLNLKEQLERTYVSLVEQSFTADEITARTSVYRSQNNLSTRFHCLSLVRDWGPDWQHTKHTERCIATMFKWLLGLQYVATETLLALYESDSARNPVRLHNTHNAHRLESEWLTASLDQAQPLTSNLIQSQPHYAPKAARDITFQDIELNRILQWRLHDIPMLLALEHYANRSHLFSSPELQHYFLVTLTEGKAFTKLLSKPELLKAHLKSLDSFVEKGFKQFAVGTPPFLFFAELAIEVYRYIALATDQDPDQRLTKLFKKLTIWLNTDEASRTSARLHLLIVRTALTLKNVQPEAIENPIFDQALLSYTCWQFYDDTTYQDGYVAHLETASLQHQFYTWLREIHTINPNLIRVLAKQVQLYVESTDEIIFEPAVYQVSILRNGNLILTFDIQSGRFYNQDGWTYQPLPTWLKQHPILEYLNQTSAYCFHSKEDKILEFPQDPYETSIQYDFSGFINQKPKFAVYQTHVIHGEKRRYALDRLPKVVPDPFELIHPSTLRFAFYFSKATRCWIGVDKPLVYIMQDQRILCSITNDQATALDPQGKKISTLVYHDDMNQATPMLYSLSSSTSYHIESFEQPRWYHSVVDPNNKQGTIIFGRFPTLKLEIQSDEIHYTHEHARYRLVKRHDALLSSKVRHLLFEKIEDPDCCIALIAMNPFKKSFSYSIFLESYSNAVDGNTDPSYAQRYYSGVERADLPEEDCHFKTFICNFNKASVTIDAPFFHPTTQKASEALFLALAYTATHCYEQAIYQLNQIQILDLNADIEECDYLKQLLSLFPNNTPAQVIACQRKAFALYTRCVQEKQNGVILFSKQDLTTLLAQLENAYARAEQDILTLPYDYQLTVLEERSLQVFILWQDESQSLDAKKSILDKGFESFAQFRPLSQPNTPESLDQVSIIIKTLDSVFYAAYHTLANNQNTVAISDLGSKEHAQQQYDNLLEKQQLISTHFGMPASRTALLKRLTQTQDYLQQKLDDQWGELVDWVAKPLYPHRSFPQLTHSEKEKIQRNLEQCYAAQDPYVYAKLVGLKKQSDIETVHGFIHAATLIEIQYQKIKRLIRELTDIARLPADEINWLSLLDLMMREQDPNVQNQVDILDFEKRTNQLVRPEQTRFAHRLSSNTVPTQIQVSSGAGKSTVIAPLITFNTPANTLRVMVVLPALFKSTHAYLHQIGAFKHQIPYALTFDSAHYSIEELDRIYLLCYALIFSPSLGKRSFILTTGPTIQSLLLEYLAQANRSEHDVINTHHDALREQKFLKLKNIFQLLIQHGRFVFDELDTLLSSIKAPMRRSLSQPTVVSRNLIADVLSLYQFKKQHHFLNKQQFVKALLTQQGPMRKHLQQCQKDNPAHSSQMLRQSVETYLLDPHQTAPSISVSPTLLSYLQIVRKQLSFFEEIQYQQYKTEYGPSNQTDALNSLCAIPYEFNLHPKNGSHFEDAQASIAYTIESFAKNLADPLLGPNAIRALIMEWRSKVNLELQDTEQYPDYQDAPTAQRFFQMFSRSLHPNELSLDDPKCVSELLQALQVNANAQTEILKHDVLPRILVEKDIILIRPMDLPLACLHPTSGMTATPSLADEHHAINQEDQENSEAFCVEVLTRKNTSIMHADYFELHTFVKNLYQQCPSDKKMNFHMMVDAGACFKAENSAVARAFAHTFNTVSHVQYVIYPDDKHELHAIATDNPECIPICLGHTTDLQVILRKLKLEDDPQGNKKLFVFCPHTHIQGFNFTLPTHAYGIVTVNKGLPFALLVQALNRLRGLSQKMEVALLLSTELKHLNTIQLVINHAQAQTKRTLPAEIYLNRENAIHGHLLADIIQQDLRSTDNHNLSAAKALYIKAEPPLASYRAHQTASTLIALGQTLLAQFGEFLIDKEVLQTKINAIATRAFPFSTATTAEEPEWHAPPPATSVETYCYVQANTADLKATGQTYSNLQPATTISWENIQLEVLNTHLPHEISAYFPSNLLASPNFLYLDRDKAVPFIGIYMKSIDLVLYMKKHNDTWRACLITTEEANDPILLDQIKAKPARMWISTLQGKVLHGTSPECVEQEKAYQELIQPIFLLAGKLYELQCTSLSWLFEETQAKLNGYKKYLMPYHSYQHDNAAHLNELETIILKRAAIFDEITKKPFVDHHALFQSGLDDQIFTAEDVHAFKMLSTAYTAMNQAYGDYDLATKNHYALGVQLRKQQKLPFSNITYILRHLEHLTALKATLDAIGAEINYDTLLKLSATETTEIYVTELLGERLQQIVDSYPDTQTWHFKLVVLSYFASSNACPNAAKRRLALPIQAYIDDQTKEAEATVVSFLQDPMMTEYRLSRLLSELRLSAATWLNLANQVQEATTAADILEYSHIQVSNDELQNIMQICFERFPHASVVLDAATKLAHMTFWPNLMEIAQTQHRLFSPEWLSIVWRNARIASKAWISLAQNEQVNDILLITTQANADLISQLTQLPESLPCFNQLCRNTTLDAALLEHLITAWILAHNVPLLAQLTSQYHPFYDPILRKIGQKEAADQAWATLLTHANVELKRQMIRQTTKQNMLYPNGAVYSILLQSYREFDDVEVVQCLLMHNGGDHHIFQLMRTQHLTSMAQEFVTQTKDLIALIEQPDSNDAIFTHIIKSTLWSTRLAKAMLQRRPSISPEIMTLLTNSNQCTTELWIMILQDSTKQAYHAQAIEVLLNEDNLRSLNNTELLALINHPECNTDQQYLKIIPYTNETRQFVALSLKVTTIDAINVLLSTSQNNPAAAQNLDFESLLQVYQVHGQANQFDDSRMNDLLSKTAPDPRWHDKLYSALSDPSRPMFGVQTALTLLQHSMSKARLHDKSQLIIQKMIDHFSPSQISTIFVKFAQLAVPISKHTSYTLVLKNIFSHIQHWSSEQDAPILFSHAIQDPNLFSCEDLQKILDKCPNETLLGMFHNSQFALTSTPPLVELKQAVMRLYQKTAEYNDIPVSERNTTLCKMSASFYLLLRHQIILFEQKRIDKHTMQHNIESIMTPYIQELSKHHDYRQIIFDILQVLSCFIGIGLGLTAYALYTKGTWRFFDYRSDERRSADDIETQIRCLGG